MRLSLARLGMITFSGLIVACAPVALPTVVQDTPTLPASLPTSEPATQVANPFTIVPLLPSLDSMPKEFLWNPNPPSTLLPPDTTSVNFQVSSTMPTSCAYSLRQPVAFNAMTPFETGQGTLAHRTSIVGLSPDPNQVNQVFIACDAKLDTVYQLKYRALSKVNPTFPRVGNLWGSGQVAKEHRARIALFMGARFKPDEIKALRRANPNVLILTDINTVESCQSCVEYTTIPDDYYLKDLQGKRIEVWPGAYRLNLTKPEVAETMAWVAYKRMLDSDLMYDGCFFDNFFTAQSWLKADIYGRAVQLDADGDGKADAPATLDAAWRAGVFHELETWRQWMPYAYTSGHLPRPPDAQVGALFNGDSVGIVEASVREGTKSFNYLWHAYDNWWQVGRQPIITMIEASPPDQIAYGYDYDPLKKIPPTTLEFARTFYPNMRFGLGLTLMNDGYFTYEFGDTHHGNDWWYDELSFNLGYPLGSATRVPVGVVSAANGIENGSFEDPFQNTWSLAVDASAKATLVRDTSEHVSGVASARVDVQSAGKGIDWQIALSQFNRSVVQNKPYVLELWAKSDSPRPLRLILQKGNPDWRSYATLSSVMLSPKWEKFSIEFEATETAQDAVLRFGVGTQTGSVWFDDVRLNERAPIIYRREFDNGLVLMNPNRTSQTIQIGAGYQRLLGSQAPLVQSIVDDGDPSFSFEGNWQTATYDSGLWKASGPFYHNWGKSVHEAKSPTASAQWDLNITASDTYTISTWLPAAPERTNWTARAVYEIIVAGKVVASKVVDQTLSGDQWYVIATVALNATERPLVRVHNEANGTLIADAIYLQSSARYNDGKAISAVTLQPMDAIILAKMR